MKQNSAQRPVRVGLISLGCAKNLVDAEIMPEVDAFMGIDQVAQVSDIVKQAIARRAEKVHEQKSKKKNQKTKVVARLNELDKGASNEHEKSESLRGTEKFGSTKTVITKY